MYTAYTRKNLTSSIVLKKKYILDDHDEQYLEIKKHYNVPLMQCAEINGEKGINKPKLTKLINEIEAGNKICVYDFSRIAYSLKELLGIISKLQQKGAYLCSVKESFDSSTEEGMKTIETMKQLYAFETDAFRERQKTGIERAKKEEKYKGRKKCPAIKRKDYNRLQRKEITKSELARELHISRPTLDRLLEEYNTIEWDMVVEIGWQKEVEVDDLEDE